MCVFNGRRVSRAEYIELMKLRKELKNAMDGQIGYGYDYSQWPIVRPTMDGQDIRISMAHWEFVPDFVYSKEDLPAFRKKYMTLNAKGETILTSPMFSGAANGADGGHCLVLSSHFYEYKHVTVGKKTEKIPFHIEVENQEYMYMGGIWRKWTDKNSGKSGDTFAILTTEANELMVDIHNSKKRMPVIFTQQQAYDWLFKEMTPEEIEKLATTKIPTNKLKAWPVAKDFLTSAEPDKEVKYAQLNSIQSLF